MENQPHSSVPYNKRDAQYTFDQQRLASAEQQPISDGNPDQLSLLTESLEPAPQKPDVLPAVDFATVNDLDAVPIGDRDAFWSAEKNRRNQPEVARAEEDEDSPKPLDKDENATTDPAVEAPKPEPVEDLDKTPIAKRDAEWRRKVTKRDAAKAAEQREREEKEALQKRHEELRRPKSHLLSSRDAALKSADLRKLLAGEVPDAYKVHLPEFNQNKQKAVIEKAIADLSSELAAHLDAKRIADYNRTERKRAANRAALVEETLDKKRFELGSIKFAREEAKIRAAAELVAKEQFPDPSSREAVITPSGKRERAEARASEMGELLRQFNRASAPIDEPKPTTEPAPKAPEPKTTAPSPLPGEPSPAGAPVLGGLEAAAAAAKAKEAAPDTDRRRLSFKRMKEWVKAAKDKPTLWFIRTMNAGLEAINSGDTTTDGDGEEKSRKRLLVGGAIGILAVGAAAYLAARTGVIGDVHHTAHEGVNTVTPPKGPKSGAGNHLHNLVPKASSSGVLANESLPITPHEAPWTVAHSLAPGHEGQLLDRAIKIFNRSQGSEAPFKLLTFPDGFQRFAQMTPQGLHEMNVLQQLQLDEIIKAAA